MTTWPNYGLQRFNVRPGICWPFEHARLDVAVPNLAR